MSLLAEISRKTEMEAICKKYASPIGETEQTRCERAERMIREAIDRQGNFSDTQKRNIRIFSQGSYRNETNITTDSDVDVGICYFGSFFTDYSLSGGRNDAHFGNISATYTSSNFD
jgi:tRNA nucleotidyltransferase (CCA-adding enzyme)